MSIATLLWWTFMQSVPAAVRFFVTTKSPAALMVNGQLVISVAEAAGTITPKQRPTIATRVSQRTTVFEIIFLPPPLYGWQSHDRRFFYLIAAVATTAIGVNRYCLASPDALSRASTPHQRQRHTVSANLLQSTPKTKN